MPYQFIRAKKWHIGWVKVDPGTTYGKLWKWILWLGPLTIRRWR